MNEVFPIVYLARHGETAWTITGQHTGPTDLPLTERGERNARRLAERLPGLTFARVSTSPMQRAGRTRDRMPRFQVTSANVREALVNERIACLQHAYEFGIDRPDLTDWKWPFWKRNTAGERAKG